ncbi:hypothetical protein [Sulfuricurvum sp.]|uniref:hypothetical protein n=1 Tax=Sulfuricurvum sp. TaxID=2025608 RepID=UPI0035622CF2
MFPHEYRKAMKELDDEENELRAEKEITVAKMKTDPTAFRKKVVKDINHKLMVLARKKSQLPLPDVYVKKNKPKSSTITSTECFFDLVPCNHEWVKANPGTFTCTKCGEVENVPEVKE